MRKIIVTISLLYFFMSALIAQNIAITDDDSYTVNPAAMLDIKSTSKGLLIPRLTTAQRNTLSSSAVSGLLVFDTDLKGFYYWNGTAWTNLTSGNASGVWGYNSPNVYLNNTNDRVGVGTTSPTGKMEVKADENLGSNDPIFHVVNKSGDTVFAVYDGAVRINVYDDPAVKASGNKGGFAVGGFAPSKGLETNRYLYVSPDSVRVYIAEGEVNKASGSKGGFAVGGFTPSKLGATDYLNIYGSANAGIVYPMKARIFWYPLKEAFLAGKVLVEKPDSVGMNSFSTGYLSRAKGDYSQAFGYQSIARGMYATAIGKNAIAKNDNSFAFGDGAKAYAENAFALGSDARALGIGSYAIGSVGRDSLGVLNLLSTTAFGDFSFAIGQGAMSTGTGAMSYGMNSMATGDFSFAAGENTYANAYAMVALGRNNSYDISSSANFWIDSDPLFVIGDGSVNSRSNAFTLLKNGKIGININNPSEDIEFEPSFSRTIGMGRSVNKNVSYGQSLTLRAGSTKALSTDANGGELILKAGNSSGAGSSRIEFHTAAPGASGMVERISTERMRLDGNGYLGINTSNASSYLSVNGSMSMPIRIVATNTTLDENDYTVLTSIAGITISLPSAIDCPGRIYVIKKTSATGTTTIDPYGAQTIDGSATRSLSTQYETVVIQSNGAVWYKIN